MIAERFGGLDEGANLGEILKPLSDLRFSLDLFPDRSCDRGSPNPLVASDFRSLYKVNAQAPRR